MVVHTYILQSSQLWKLSRSCVFVNRMGRKAAKLRSHFMNEVELVNGKVLSLGGLLFTNVAEQPASLIGRVPEFGGG